MFDDYIKSVCKGVKSERKKTEIKEELLSHLTETYGQNIAVGMDDVTAQENAIERMGNKDELKEQFAALYSISPPDYMRSSINFLIFGILFTCFHLDFFAGAGRIQLFLGEMLILYSLFKIREINRSLKTAFYFFPLLLLYENMSLFIQTYFYPSESVIEFLIWLPLALNAVFYRFLFFGLSSACNSVKTENDKRPHLLFCYLNIMLFFYMLPIAAADIDSGLFLFLILPFFIPLLGLRRVKRILGRKEPEFDLSYTLKKKDKRSYGVLVVFFLILPIFIMIISATRKPETHIYNPVDTAESVETVQAAREHMLELGFPKEYLDDLPDSEVLRYRTATYFEKHEDSQSKYIGANIKAYIFYFSTEYNEKTESYDLTGIIRILYRIELSDDIKTNYKKGFYAKFSEQTFLWNFDDTYGNERNSIFFTALSNKDGKTLFSEPFKTYMPRMRLYNSGYSGAEYSFADKSTNRRAYFANAAVLKTYSHQQIAPFEYEYYIKTIPLYTMYNHFSEEADMSMNGSSIPDPHDFTRRHINVYDYFEFDPIYSFTIEEPVTNTDE
ncbi:MAG: hypothetical protein J1F23_07155 [Oscillospiraceae bacterium]|nr:hypothetical protein [Oscillospiraceae bacterium]